MMTNGRQRPRRMPGGVAGNLPLWLAATATAVGFLYLLVRDDATQPPGTPEEIAERVKPVGRVVLAAPAEPAQASQKATAPASVETESEEAKVAEPVQGLEASVSPEPQPASEAADAAPTVSAREPADETVLPPAAESEDSAQLTTDPVPAEATKDPLALEPAGPPEAQVPSDPVSIGGAVSPAEPAATAPVPMASVPSAAARPVHASLPAAGLPEADMPPTETPDWQPPPPAYRMIWVRRYDLPGQPFELRSAPPEGR